MKIKGNTVGTPMPRSDWEQTNPKKADYIHNKPKIPTKTSDLTNDSGFLTQHQDLSAYAKKDELPTKMSQLTNDSGLITKAVTDLVNYYTKSQIYTKDEINNLVSAVPKFSIQVVSSLPTSNISSTTVYLLKSGDEQDNLYTEYIYVDGAWEYLGRQTVDLTGYALKTDIPTKLSALTDDVGYITQAALSSALDGYAQKATTLAGYGITDGATTAQLEQLSNEKVDKTGLTLGAGTDGLIYIFVDGVQTGAGVALGEIADVYGYIDANKHIVFEGLADESGTYTASYKMEDGTLVSIGALEFMVSVTNNLTNCTSNNNATDTGKGKSYSATISANSGYNLSSVAVTMGGVDITSSAVSGGSISIAEVTGDIVITAVAEEIQASYTNLAEPNTTNTTDWDQWCNSARIGSDGAYRSGTLSVTNYIPVSIGDTVRWNGFTIASSNSLAFYKSDKTVCNAGVGTPSLFAEGSSAVLGDLSTTNNSGQFTILDHSYLNGLTYIKLSGTLTGTIDDVIITINEPIE